MIVDDMVFSALHSPYRFWIKKMGYAGRALVMILMMSRDEAELRWRIGQEEHGKMTNHELMNFYAWRNLKEEMIDGFWYSEMIEAKKIEVEKFGSN